MSRRQKHILREDRSVCAVGWGRGGQEAGGAERKFRGGRGGDPASLFKSSLLPLSHASSQRLREKPGKKKKSGSAQKIAKCIKDFFFKKNVFYLFIYFLTASKNPSCLCTLVTGHKSRKT